MKMKKVVAMLLSVAMVASMAVGCGSKDDSKDANEDGKKVLKFAAFEGGNGTEIWENIEKAFEESHEDVDVQLELSSELDKDLTKDFQNGDIPDVVYYNLGQKSGFTETMLKEHAIADISDVFDDELKSKLVGGITENAAAQPYGDGKVYLAPIIYTPTGLWYNKDMFGEGKYTLPTTWDEFWACCDKLTNAGITPLALHTDGTGWAPMLLASAAVASSSEEGAEFLSLIYPDTYQNASGLDLANTLKRLFSYTTSNALYNDFDTAYNNFFTGKAAMVPNGYWMIDQIPNGWEQCVRFSSFPGNTLVSSPETFGWALTSGCSEEVKEGALAFFKFRTEFNLLEKETMLSMEEKYISQVERDYRNAFSDSPTFVPNYQVKWNSVFQENTLSKYLPQLAEGRITPEDFLNYADDSIRQFEEEQ